MKKLANIFSIITIILGGLGIIVNLIEMICHLFGRRGGLNYIRGGEYIITLIVLVIFLTAIPDLIKRAIQIIFGLITRNPQGGQKTVLNWLAVAIVIVLPIIGTIAYSFMAEFCMRTLSIDGSVYSAFQRASSAPLATIINTLASYSLVIASIFAISEKKTAPDPVGEYIEEQ